MPESIFGLIFDDDLPEGLHPLEAILIVTGVVLETGNPTYSVIATEGMTPWHAVGIMETEVFRQKLRMAAFAAAAEAETDED